MAWSGVTGCPHNTLGITPSDSRTAAVIMAMQRSVGMTYPPLIPTFSQYCAARMWPRLFPYAAWRPPPRRGRAGVGVNTGGAEIASFSPHPDLPPPGGKGQHAFMANQVPNTIALPPPGGKGLYLPP